MNILVEEALLENFQEQRHFVGDKNGNPSPPVEY